MQMYIYLRILCMLRTLATIGINHRNTNPTDARVLGEKFKLS